MQGPIRNIILNVRQQIFVGRDSKSGRSALPLNFKGTANIEIGKAVIARSLGLICPLPRMPGKWHPTIKTTHAASKTIEIFVMK